jgi:hypothetical protein
VGLRAATHFVGSPFPPRQSTGSRTRPWLYAATLSGLTFSFTFIFVGGL